MSFWFILDYNQLIYYFVSLYIYYTLTFCQSTIFMISLGEEEFLISNTPYALFSYSQETITFEH